MTIAGEVMGKVTSEVTADTLLSGQARAEAMRCASEGSAGLYNLLVMLAGALDDAAESKAAAWDEGWKALEMWTGEDDDAINPYRTEDAGDLS